jgi:putative iron-dependent peroxidase
MSDPQPGVLSPPPTFARFVTAQLLPDVDTEILRELLLSFEVDESLAIGLGPSAVQRLGVQVDSLRPFPALSGDGFDVPSTQSALWFWLRDTAPGNLVHRFNTLIEDLVDVAEVDAPVDAFKYGEGAEGRGLDLTGYEDGTENPIGDDAVAAGIVEAPGPLAGSSHVAVQLWEHDLARFAGFAQAEQDNIIGRRKSDNEELDDAPASAHVKRTAQEDFDPPAFVVRRSMPWAGPDGEGLVFVAFGASLDAFEAQLRRMVGLDDGIHDALFSFSRPVAGGYYWCPPVRGGRLVLG